MSPVEAVGVVSGILGVWLTTRQKIWCWPIGIVSVLCFVVVFFSAKLYGAMGLQLVYVGLLAYGWRAWLHGGASHGALRVTHAPARLLGVAAAGGAAAALAFGWWLGRSTDEALPYLDAFTTVFSLVAQWMQARKQIENWLLWIVVDVVYVGMGVTQGLNLTSGLYLVYAGLAVLGYREWRRSMRMEAAA